MKVRPSQLRELLNEEFQKVLEDVDRERRLKAGYDESPGEVDYGDLPESVENMPEDVDRVRRHMDGYGDDLEEADDDEEKAKSHAAPADVDDAYPGPPMGMGGEVMDKRARLHMIPQEDPIPVPPVHEVTPPGMEKVVKALKKEPGVDNPWAVAWAMKNKGAKPKKESVMPSLRSVLLPTKKKK